MHEHRVVFEVNVHGTEQWQGVLNNVENLQKAFGRETTDIEVVLHGKGLGLILQTNEAMRERLQLISDAAVHFAACENTMRRMNLKREDLMPFATTVDSGVAEVVRKQEAGWSYISSQVRHQDNVMAQQRQQVRIGDEKRATEYLANERTFLAWIRTSIAIISLGFVVAKFSLWLRELATQLAPQMQISQVGASMPIGVTMMALGGVLAVLAAWRYHVVNRAIENGVVSADRGLVILVTVMVALLCVAMIAYMLITAQHA